MDGHRTLADQFRSWPDQRLSRLLRDRPDLATPAPHDSAHLASRTATRSSLSRALDRLDRFELTVLDALVVAGQTTPDQLASLVYADPGAVAAAVDRLVDLAVAWEAPGGVRPLTGVAECLTAGPAAGVSGVKPLAGESPAYDAAVEQVTARLAEISPAARALLEHVDAQGGTGSTGAALADVRPGTYVGERRPRAAGPALRVDVLEQGTRRRGEGGQSAPHLACPHLA